MQTVLNHSTQFILLITIKSQLISIIYLNF